jgi:ABC-type glycerol-3-phosphate transport system substrate-binding protein
MSRHMIIIRLLAIGIMLGLAACAPAATVTSAPAATKAPVGPTTVNVTKPPTSAPTKPPAPTTAPAKLNGVVNFMTWAADAFELQALVKTVNTFAQNNSGVKVNCTIMTDAQSAAALPAGSAKICNILTQ